MTFIGSVAASGTTDTLDSSSTLTVTVGTNNDKTNYSLSATQTFTHIGNVSGNITGSVGSVTAVNDKTGYSLASEQTYTLIGNVSGNVNGSVGSVVGAVGSVAGNVSGSVASVTGNVAGSVASVVGAVGSVTGAVGSVTTITDKTGYSLSSAAITSVQSGLATSSALSTVDSNIDTLVSQISTLYYECTGKWDIINNQLIIYRADGVTEVMRFDLTVDDDGNYTTRTPV